MRFPVAEVHDTIEELLVSSLSSQGSETFVVSSPSAILDDRENAPNPKNLHRKPEF
jgi:hypothetical protein